MNLVVVESPAKARTIEKYLGPDYRVLATYGHVCDLPPKDGSVRPDDDFAMVYVTDGKSERHLKAIAKAARQSDAVILATDPDREGEAISWHVLNYLKDRGKLGGAAVQRVVFHEITANAVRDAFTHPREIDMNLVNAQQARRALDYLVGFTLSPVLWRKVPGARSAGRVQSVALRLICEREQEIEAFVVREYWTVEAALTTAAGAPISARLTHLDGAKLEKFSLPDEAAARAAVAAVRSRALAVAKVERKQVQRKPPPPFTTSTLQQDASRKLGMTTKRVMRVAQRLYEGVEVGGETVGLITYMRTDSVTLADGAIATLRRAITDTYGPDYLPAKARRHKTRTRNAQEAHEAIRPTDPARAPGELARRLEKDEYRLYELIWKRTLACQMENARIDQVAVDIASPDNKVVLRASGSVVAFDGFLKLYGEGGDDGAENGKAADGGGRLPTVAEGDPLALGAVTPEQHFTEPRPRYSEATLVKAMEELGIGRPSTYASIISVLQDRDYVRLDRKRFVPEWRGRLVTSFLESFFERYVRYDFTADLEDQLDRVSDGELDWKAVLEEFWSAFSMAVGEISHLRVAEVLDKLDEMLGPHIFPETGGDADPRRCPSCGDGRLSLKLGKFGAFIGCSNYPGCRYTRQIANRGNGEGETAAQDGPRQLGEGPGGESVTLRDGPYGPYLQLGDGGGGAKPKRVSLPKGLAPDKVDLETALALLDLPRALGPHPETGEMITAGIGRYGPYLKHAGRFRSLPDDEDALTVGLNRAVSLLAEPVRGRGRATPLRVLGPHPDDGGEIAIYRGRYGPYLKHRDVIANLPKDAAPEDVTIADAVPLLAAKAGAKAAKGRRRKAPRKKPARAAN